MQLVFNACVQFIRCNAIFEELFTENVTLSAKYHIISFAILLVLNQGLSNWALGVARGSMEKFREKQFKNFK